MFVGLILLQSCLLLAHFRQMYAAGVTHLAELIDVGTSIGDQPPLPSPHSPPPTPRRLLFVNFPDRYAPRRPPYPFGYWGLTLAPVSVDLGAYPAITAARPLDALSRSLPWIDAEARAASPYQVDLRGVITPPEELYQLAHDTDGVYLSRYFADGHLALQWAGAVGEPPLHQSPLHQPSLPCRLAQFGETLCLQEAQVMERPGQLELTLAWFSLAAAQPHETIFAHLGQEGQPPLAQADGDAWLGLLPLATCRPGDTIYERRLIELPPTISPGRYTIGVGVYNRLTGHRLPAVTAQGEPLPGDAAIVSYRP